MCLQARQAFGFVGLSCFCDTASILLQRTAVMNKLKQHVLDLAVFLGVLFCVLVALEWVFPRLFSTLFPLDAVQSFEEPYGVAPLMIDTKRHFLPKDYIALVGDSYAMGMGDETMARMLQRKPRFGSAPILHESTGRDVISYGQPGSGSLRGLVGNPVSGQMYIREYLDRSLEDPAWVVLYFYEGNDLSENWMYYEKTFPKFAPAEDYYKPETFERYIEQVTLGKNRLFMAATQPRWFDRWLFPRYVYRAVSERLFKHKPSRRHFSGEAGLIYIPPERWIPRHVSKPVNRIRLGDQIVPVPDNLQGPALDLDDTQLHHALGTFDRSLAYARKRFPRSRFAVVYVPSVLTSYTFPGDSVHAQNYFGNNNLFARAEVDSRHRKILAEVSRICSKQQVEFTDTTSDLRSAAAQAAIHGPSDWNHLTQAGYEVLGQSVVRQLPELQQSPQ